MWHIPDDTFDRKPRLMWIHWKQHFYTCLTVRDMVYTCLTVRDMVLGKMYIYHTLSWTMELNIRVDPTQPLGESGLHAYLHTHAHTCTLTHTHTLPSAGPWSSTSGSTPHSRLVSQGCTHTSHTCTHTSTHAHTHTNTVPSAGQWSSTSTWTPPSLSVSQGCTHTSTHMHTHACTHTHTLHPQLDAQLCYKLHWVKTCTHTHTHTFSLSVPLSLSHMDSLIHTLALSLSLSHRHTYTFPILSLTHTLSLSLSLTHMLSHTHTLSHTQHTHTHSLTHTHTHSLSLSHTHTHTLHPSLHLSLLPHRSPRRGGGSPRAAPAQAPQAQHHATAVRSPSAQRQQVAGAHLVSVSWHPQTGGGATVQHHRHGALPLLDPTPHREVPQPPLSA